MSAWEPDDCCKQPHHCKWGGDGPCDERLYQWLRDNGWTEGVGQFPLWYPPPKGPTMSEPRELSEEELAAARRHIDQSRVDTDSGRAWCNLCGDDWNHHDCIVAQADALLSHLAAREARWAQERAVYRKWLDEAVQRAAKAEDELARLREQR